MPIIELNFPPGIRDNGTSNQSEMRWERASLVRWANGEMTPIGGFQQSVFVKPSGTTRKALAWVANGSQVSGNNFVDSPITAQSRRVEVQSADFVFDNPGYTRITRGQAVIGPAFRVLAVNHNQPVTPDIGDFTLTFRSTDTGFSRFWIDNVTSAQFTINLNANPATAVTIDWRVDTERK